MQTKSIHLSHRRRGGPRKARFLVVILTALLVVMAIGAVPAYAKDAGAEVGRSGDALQGTPEAAPNFIHTVQSGDTLWGLARRYGTSVWAIMQVNGLRGTRIYVGQRLTIPVQLPEPGTVYVVRRGDTLWRLARRYGTTVDAIMEANGLRSTRIYVGQRLRIPGREPAPASPAVTISPTSGPAGSLVMVAASGFPPNTWVTVGVGPENSEFSQTAQGRTDVNGVFAVHVPVQGGPGMKLVFAVAAQGQPGVTAPERFRITGAVPTVVPTPTPYQDMWTTFSSAVFAVSLDYPADWQPIPGYGCPETDAPRFGGINGFFQISAMDSESIDAAAAAEAGHKLRPYGSQPTIETLHVQGEEARLILPSDDQPTGMQHQAALIVRYPKPVNVLGTPCRYLVLWADGPHIRTIAQTLRFTG